jgi:hypothetical protein
MEDKERDGAITLNCMLPISVRFGFGCSWRRIVLMVLNLGVLLPQYKVCS